MRLFFVVALVKETKKTAAIGLNFNKIQNAHID
jgi:hypothetical protein